MIASKSSPHRKGLRVTSNTHRSTIRRATPYCAAARMIPGCFSVASQHDLSAGRLRASYSPFPRICRPSMSEPNTRAPKQAVV